MKTIGLKQASMVIVLIMSLLALKASVQGQSILAGKEPTRNFEPVPPEKGMILCSREIKLKSNIDPKVFEKWINEYWNLKWQDLIPGFQSYVAKKEQDYYYYMVFNPKRIRNTNLSNSNQNIEWYRELIYYEPTKHLYDELFEFIEIDSFFNNMAWSEIK